MLNTNHFSYSNFANYVVRTPVYSLEYLNNIEPDLFFFKKIPDFLDYVKIASPSLFNAFNRWITQPEMHKKEQKKIFYSLFKYFVRSSMRCTPFGFFAGLSVGTIDENSNTNNLFIKHRQEHKPHTRLDMNYLCSIVSKIEKDFKIRQKLKYTLNNTLYLIGDKVRYVEYFLRNTNRYYVISQININPFIEKIIFKTTNEQHTIDELADFLLSDSIAREDALIFIHDLIDIQVLVSNLYPTVTGEEFHSHVINTLREKGLLRYSIPQKLYELKNITEAFDNCSTENFSSLTAQLLQKVKSIGVPYNEKFLLHIDLITQYSNNTICSQIIEDIVEGLRVLNKLTPPQLNIDLQTFKNKFIERYEYAEVPILHVLDPETGIGYPTSKNVDVSPFIDDIILPQKYDSVLYKTNISKQEKYLIRKLLENKNNDKLILDEKDLEQFNENWEDLPSTFSVMTNIVKIDNCCKVVIKHVSGTSAINLIGRFSHADKNIELLVNSIASKEKEISSDVLLAEIVHLPQSRIGNILLRTSFRDYEIPYLAQSTITENNIIELNDVMLSIRKNKLVLRSKKFNKEIVPCLGTAHNFSLHTLPVYRFLADIQTQNKRRFMSLRFGTLTEELSFIPRVEYKNVILSLATWIIHNNEIKEIINEQDTEYSKLKKFIKSKKIPNDVVLIENEDEFYINFKNLNYIEMFIQLVKEKKTPIILKEFLFMTSSQLVRDAVNNNYANEIIFSFYKNNKK